MKDDVLYRPFSDVDILIESSDIDIVDAILQDNGFVQGEFHGKDIKNNILSSISMSSVPVSVLSYRNLSLIYAHIVNGRFL